MAVKLIAQLFEHTNFCGQYRYLCEDVTDFNILGFNDRAFSIKILKGPDYKRGDVARFYEHTKCQGRYVDLMPGFYPDIHESPFNFAGIISSAYFVTLPELLSAALRESTAYVIDDSSLDAPPIEIIVKAYESVGYNGQMRTLIYNEPNFLNIGFDNKFSSIRVFRGPEYSNQTVNFFELENFGGVIVKPGNFIPGTSIPDLISFKRDCSQKISSLKISIP
jgi:hypothetical protein